MKKHFNELLRILPLSFIFSMMMLTLSGCQIIGGIFKAGVWVGIIIVVIIVVIILYIFGKVKK